MNFLTNYYMLNRTHHYKIAVSRAPRRICFVAAKENTPLILKLTRQKPWIKL